MTSVVVNGLKDVRDYFEQLPEIANKAAALAINDVAGGTGLTMLRKAVYDEIEFPKGYLDKTRLGLTKPATVSRLEATIKGRDRPTSLARFASRGQYPGVNRKQGVRVVVKNGRTKTFRKGWLVKLKNDNIGLAVRVGPGDRLNKHTPGVHLAPNVLLLYGPSVDQVFRGVADDNSDKLAQMVSSEFLRQMTRLSRG